MNSLVLSSWAVLCPIVVITVVFVRYRRNKRFDLELAECLSLLLAMLGMISSIELLHKAFTLKALQDLLGLDIVTLVIGAIAVIWVSAKEIWKAYLP